MKKTTLIILFISAFSFAGFSQNFKNYMLINSSLKQLPGMKKKVKIPEINQKDIDRLNEPLKALAAYYSGLGGSECDEGKCQLTTALGMGKQGSDLQKNIILKWFPNDAAAKILLKQNCFQGSSSSSTFSQYSFLKFIIKSDTAFVYYKLICYNHGRSITIVGPDKYIIKPNHISVLNRNIWK